MCGNGLPHSHAPEVCVPTEEVSTDNDYARLLADPSALVGKRYNALFEARSYLTAQETVAAVLGLLQPHTPSILLRHEACYVLGQCGHSDAVPRLRSIVQDDSEHEITRHEAVEALAALGDRDCVDILKATAEQTDSVPLRETCELAIQRLSQEPELSEVEKSDYNTVDPVSTKGLKVSEADVITLRDKMLSPETCLADKYAALFSLRGIRDSKSNPSMKAAQAIAYVMRHDSSSALFRHELAFVIAQVAFDKPDVELIDMIASCFQNDKEHCMVRHEAAVALGSIGGQRSYEVLSDYVKDKGVDSDNQDEAIVVESCIVALESLSYWANQATAVN